MDLRASDAIRAVVTRMQQEPPSGDGSCGGPVTNRFHTTPSTAQHSTAQHSTDIRSTDIPSNAFTDLRSMR
ncbi:hypothetical protein [Roseimaritima multifibrata]|uniref:hypothetical protein n=1 Tax=Roseimaritima multifibrata TaxID=1930274 RepID=UPI0011A51024|nr:hypothetical protein [Roseimaritima multifibrata]